MKARQHERSETATGKISMGGAVALYRGAHRIGMYKFKSSGFEEFLPKGLERNSYECK
jgi:hypothetical protein